MMHRFRATPPQQILGSDIVEIKDYKSSISKDVRSGKESTINLPKSDVLQFITEDGTKISIRPSGTEPKIKFYFGVKGELANSEDFDNVNNALDTKIKAIKTSLNLE